MAADDAGAVYATPYDKRSNEMKREHFEKNNLFRILN